eukprot:6138716-Alexandrium_andersonii.AAC.1
MVQAALVRRGLPAFLVASLLQYVEGRVRSVQGLNERLRPAGLGDPLVLFQGQAEETARALGGRRTS